ncbi:MAG: gamma-butyrobetaine hydroxylase-like domain-containing protein [Opitutaceae bacterium]
MTARPQDIKLIGTELCIRWDDGSESYYPAEFLRKHSPSAQNIGERDILGNQYGGDGPKEFPDVTITGWDFQGNYAMRPSFSDGHSSGLFSWEFLKSIEAKLNS